MVRACAALGSNAPDARARLAAARDALRAEFAGLRCSSVYRSADHTGGAAPYLNAVVMFDTALAPDELRGRFRALEAAAGLLRDGSGEVSLDIDLLLYGERVDAGPPVLPHPDVLGAPHVLAPLAALAPALRHPVTGERMSGSWARRPPHWPVPEDLGTL